MADTDHSSTSSKSSKGSQRSFRRSARIPYRRASHRMVGSFSRSSSISPDSQRSHRYTLQQDQDFLQLFSKMAVMQAESHFKKEEVCGGFRLKNFKAAKFLPPIKTGGWNCLTWKMQCKDSNTRKPACIECSKQGLKTWSLIREVQLMIKAMNGLSENRMKLTGTNHCM